MQDTKHEVGVAPPHEQFGRQRMISQFGTATAAADARMVHQFAQWRIRPAVFQ